MFQQRERVASVVHRQETVDCLKKFNARRKLKVSPTQKFCSLCIFIQLAFIYISALNFTNDLLDRYTILRFTFIMKIYGLSFK